MAGERLVIEFSSIEELIRQFDEDLCHGGAFAKGASKLERGQDVELVLVHPSNSSELILDGAVSLVVPRGESAGVGVAISNFSSSTCKKIEEFIKNGGKQKDPPKKENLSVHERLRGLSSREQMRMARSRNLSERVALERIYGKFVWEPLLRNASITVPEVARIARMGNIPRPLLEFVVSNGAWINTPHVRRALLSNPRLTGEMINKVVRVMSQNELKLAKKQTSYSQAVRNAAAKILKS